MYGKSGLSKKDRRANKGVLNFELQRGVGKKQGEHANEKKLSATPGNMRKQNKTGDWWEKRIGWWTNRDPRFFLCKKTRVNYLRNPGLLKIGF